MTDQISRIDGTSGARRHFRYFDYMMAAFVGILLLSNLIGASKLATVQGWTFGAGILFFPVSYVLGDVLTEVYGYANARRCVWMGFRGAPGRGTATACRVAESRKSGKSGRAVANKVSAGWVKRPGGRRRSMPGAASKRRAEPTFGAAAVSCIGPELAPGFERPREVTGDACHGTLQLSRPCVPDRARRRCARRGLDIRDSAHAAARPRSRAPQPLAAPAGRPS